MKKNFITVVVGLLLGLSSIVLAPATPASADQYDAASFWYCAKHRPANTVVIHSWPYALGPNFVGYWCEADFYGHSWQYWVHVSPPGSSNSWRPWAYQKCLPEDGGIVWCGTAGH